MKMSAILSSRNISKIWEAGVRRQWVGVSFLKKTVNTTLAPHARTSEGTKTVLSLPKCIQREENSEFCLFFLRHDTCAKSSAVKVACALCSKKNPKILTPIQKA